MPNNPAPFVRKTYDIVSDPSTDAIVCWSSTGRSFLVVEEHAFQKEVLPKYFKHDNLCSFIRQLNTYGFRKISSAKDLNSSHNVLEFEQPDFRRDHPELLANLKRKQKKKSLTGSAPPTPDPSTPGMMPEGAMPGTDMGDVLSDRTKMAAALSTLIKQQQETEKTLKFLWGELSEAKRVVMQLENKKRQRSPEDEPTQTVPDSPATRQLKRESESSRSASTQTRTVPPLHGATRGATPANSGQPQEWLSSDNEDSDVASAARNMAELSSQLALRASQGSV